MITNQVQTVASNQTIMLGDMAGAVALRTKKGKLAGVRVHFAQGMTASQVKAMLKDKNPDLKGNALREKVDSVLRGEQDVRWAAHEVAVSALRSAGYVPDYVDQRKGGATARFVKLQEAEKAEITREAALAALGLKDGELEQLLAARSLVEGK